MSRKEFERAARAQSAQIAASLFEADDQAFVDSVSEFSDGASQVKVRRARD
jgi:hypothetical protein